MRRWRSRPRTSSARSTNCICPRGIRGSFDGNAGDFNKTSGRQPLLILGALVAMYIVLGVLYESLAHPLTISRMMPIKAITVSGVLVTWSASSAPRPAEGKVEMIVSGCARLS